MGYPTIGFNIFIMMEKQSDLNSHEVVELLLKKLRMQSGMRQVDVASKLGIQQSMVSKYESGERRLDILEIRELCHLFKISLSKFVELLENHLECRNETN